MMEFEKYDMYQDIALAMPQTSADSNGFSRCVGGATGAKAAMVVSSTRRGWKPCPDTSRTFCILLSRWNFV
jgi:hypothetical protein